MPSGKLIGFSKNWHCIEFVMSEIVEFDILLIFIRPELSYFIFFKMAMAAILKNRHFENFLVNFERYMGAIFFFQGFQLTNQSRNKDRKKMVMDLAKMTL